jgi:hypothetical protein
MNNGLKEKWQRFIRGIKVSDKKVLQIYLHYGIFRL